jgi:hypothetical protein
MRMLQISSFAVFAVAVGAVWQTSTAPVTPAQTQEKVMERPIQCGARWQSQDFSAMNTSEEGRSSVQGPRTLEEGAAPGVRGSCIDCSPCWSNSDCEPTGYNVCFEHCP